MKKKPTKGNGMFIIREVYSFNRMADNTYKTEKEAMDEAVAKAELDNESLTYIVAEVKGIVKPDPIKHPDKIYEGDQAAPLLIEQEKEDKNESA